MKNSELQGGHGQREGLEALVQSALLLDLEVSHQGRIIKIGAAFGAKTLVRSGRSDLAGALDELSGMAASARCIVGHNLVRHDLRVLRETSPRQPLLRLPVIDTLVLSPITFPENPYHRLVKDYKLVRASANDPVADARQAAALFADEFRALEGMRQTEPRLFERRPITPSASTDTGRCSFRAVNSGRMIRSAGAGCR